MGLAAPRAPQPCARQVCRPAVCRSRPWKTTLCRNGCIPGLQLLHLPSPPAHTSPTALSHPAGVFQRGRARLGTRSTQHRAEAGRTRAWEAGGGSGLIPVGFSCSAEPAQTPKEPPAPLTVPLSPWGMLHLTYAELVTYPSGPGWTGCVPSGCSSPSGPAGLGEALSAGGGRGCRIPPLPVPSPRGG